MSIFSKIKIPKRRRSNFDLSHEVKTTTEFGRLTPFMCMEVLPGDSFKCNANVFARMAPMIAPIMSRVDLYTHFFFVPNRLLWEHWEEFITGGEDGLSTPQLPKVSARDLKAKGLWEIGTLVDYFGLPVQNDPTKLATGEDAWISELPFRAYAKIYNDWYRDQNLQSEVGIHFHDSGKMSDVQDLSFYQPRYRAWKKDYFTSALPWPQRGPEVKLPFHDEMEVKYRSNEPSILKRADGNPAVQASSFSSTNQGTLTTVNAYYAGGTQTQQPTRIETPAYVNPNTAAPTINELRRSLRVQEWLENNARGGARYIEQILSHFGVKSSDARLNRAEYLGGGKSPIMISEVVQTSATDLATPQGNLAGHGVSAGASHTFKRHFEEHGYIIGILSILPKATYQQGIERHWSRADKFDFAWPEFANIGEQEILNQELFFGNPIDGIVSGMKDVFGYTPRYSEYKYKSGMVTGDFRTNLAFWHLGRIFRDQPKLNTTFIQCRNVQGSTNLNRIFAVDDFNNRPFMISIFNNVTAKRVLPYYGIPTI